MLDPTTGTMSIDRDTLEGLFAQHVPSSATIWQEEKDKAVREYLFQTLCSWLEEHQGGPEPREEDIDQLVDSLTPFLSGGEETHCIRALVKDVVAVRQGESGHTTTLTQQRNTEKYDSLMSRETTPLDARPHFEPYILLLMGLPGSGKSTLANQLENVMPWKYVRVCQDHLGSRQACLDQAEQVIQEGRKCPIIDRTNVSQNQRQDFIELASRKKCPIDCIVLDLDRDKCVRRCQQRRNHPTLRPQGAARVVGFMAQEWNLPSERHGFRRICHIRGRRTWQQVLQELTTRE